MYHRLFQSDDFPECVGLIPKASGLEPKLLARLPSIWSRLLAADQIRGSAIIDPDAPGKPIVAFGMSTFLRESFVGDYLSCPVPYLSARTYERLLAGQSPFLSPRELAIGNAERTLTLVILHFGAVQRVGSDADSLRAIGVAQTAFRLLHSGYRLKRVLQEGYGDDQLPFFKAAGFQMKSDYSDWYRQGRRVPPAGDRPYLMGLYREDRESQYPGTAMGDLFQAFEPRFHFSPAERRVLQHAIMDESDEAIAATLGVSRDAVKKVWRRIYDRVAAVDPALLGLPPAGVPTRGKERRRSLIHYLRFHLEDVRPFAVSRARTASPRPIRAVRD